MFKKKKETLVIDWLNEQFEERINEKLKEVLKTIDDKIKEKEEELDNCDKLYTSAFKEMMGQYNESKNEIQKKHPIVMHKEYVANLTDLSNEKLIDVRVRNDLLSVKREMESIMRASNPYKKDK